MSLSLNINTRPRDLSVKTHSDDPTVYFTAKGINLEISLLDFLAAAHYVLTNSNLEEDDPRFQFLECVRSMKPEDVGRGKQRLESSVPLITPDALAKAGFLK